MVSALSGLTKKTVYADKILAQILGVKEGEHVSYADLSKGLTRYVRDNNLRNTQVGNVSAPQVALVASPPSSVAETVITTVLTKKCGACDGEIPVEAAFCDLCGARQ
jgi:hypothetical protein